MSTSERGHIINLLKSDLFERVEDPDPMTGMTWRNALGWQVRLSGKRDHPIVDITAPNGERFWHGSGVSAPEVHAILP